MNKMSETFLGRQKKTSEYLAEEGITAAVLKDFEGSRNSSVRYLTGHPQDALLFIFSDSPVILLPWDVLLAEKTACCSEIIPYTDYNRNFINAAAGVSGDKEAVHAMQAGAGKKPGLEFSSASSWLEILSLKKEIPHFEIICRENGIDCFLDSCRMIKDKAEIEIYREASAVTDKIIDHLEQYIRKNLTAGSGKIKESDIAFTIEKLAREAGCEGTGFETLAASAERSWAIHPWPSFSSAQVHSGGLTIIDFGIRHKGYTTDVTMTIAGKNLTDKQKEMISLVEKASSLAEKSLMPGTTVSSPADAVELLFKKQGYSMPHSLGHGIGLDVHEPPLLKAALDNPPLLKPGMVITLEPGLYDPDEGGVRLENDYLITQEGSEKLTNSRIVFL
ncbi:MAG: Xaa-Pro peptidase family protein [Spirochaetia bacterium]|jgi:Xaa-Pro dipeptidase|nr:Xaa-Pro peptidase family protein [Spirochaetia bacterium]